MAEIPPFDHAAVIAGQGTLGLEIIEDAPELETLLVPLSGGGLISGVALAVKTLKPDMPHRRHHHGARRGDGGEPRRRPSGRGRRGAHAGRFAGRRHRHATTATPSRWCKALVDETVLVSEDEIAAGIRAAYEEEGEVIEGGAAVGIAALIAGKVKPQGADGDRALRQEHRARAAPQHRLLRERRAIEGHAMTDMTILTEAELRTLVPLDMEAVATVEDAFRALAGGQVVMPPILRLDIPEAHGEVDVKTAYVPGFDGFAIKVSPGFFDNPKLGLPSVNGLMVFLSARTGLVEALLLDNGYLTDVRTAAAGAVAARHLSRAGRRGRRDPRRRRAGAPAARGADAWCARSARRASGRGPARRRRRRRPRRR